MSPWSQDSRHACPDVHAQRALYFPFPTLRPLSTLLGFAGQCCFLSPSWPQIIRQSHSENLCKQSDTGCLKSQCRREAGALGDSRGSRAIFLLDIFKGVSPTPSHGSLWEFPKRRGLQKWFERKRSRGMQLLPPISNKEGFPPLLTMQQYNH